MRLSRCLALFVTAVAASTLWLALAAPKGAQAAESAPAEKPTCNCPGQDAPMREARPKFADLQSGFDEGDEIAALEAIRIALTEIGDGSTFVWRRANGRISGAVKPTSSFRNVQGRVCRHILIVLAAGTRTGKIEGVACRLDNGRWELDG
jgi:17 kDa outer membrane surface antigen